jgi:hypothetical protein
MKSPIFWDITPCSPLKMNQRFGRTSRLHLQGRRTSQANQYEAGTMLVSCLVYSSTLKMEAICFSETSVDFQRAIWRYIPEDRTSVLFLPTRFQIVLASTQSPIFPGLIARSVKLTKDLHLMLRLRVRVFVCCLFIDALSNKLCSIKR